MLLQTTKGYVPLSAIAFIEETTEKGRPLRALTTDGGEISIFQGALDAFTTMMPVPPDTWEVLTFYHRQVNNPERSFVLAWGLTVTGLLRPITARDIAFETSYVVGNVVDWYIRRVGYPECYQGDSVFDDLAAVERDRAQLFAAMRAERYDAGIETPEEEDIG